MNTIIGLAILVFLIYISWVLSGPQRQKMQDKRDTKRLHEGLKEAAEILQQRDEQKNKL